MTVTSIAPRFCVKGVHLLTQGKAITPLILKRSFPTLSKCDANLLRLVENQHVVTKTVQEVIQKTLPFKNVHVDIGTGDGKFIYHQAKRFPQTYYIGIDSNQSSMNYLSWKIKRKPSKGGGQNNIALIHSFFELLPDEFKEIGDSISINFPWGSLMKGVVVPYPHFLSKIARIGKDNCSIEILLNHSVFQDHVYRKKLQLPHVTLDYACKHLKVAFSSNNINISEVALETLSKNKSTWGSQLTLGGGREVLRMAGHIKHLHEQL